LTPAISKAADITGVTIQPAGGSEVTANTDDNVITGATYGLGVPDPLGQTTNGIITKRSNDSSATNTITVSGPVEYSVVGGIQVQAAPTSANSNGNTVNVTTGGIVGVAPDKGAVAGGLSYVTGGHANTNKVNVQGSVYKLVIGGIAANGGGTADGNEVRISGDAQVGAVFGGDVCSYNIGVFCGTAATGTAQNNNIYYSGSNTSVVVELTGGRVGQTTGSGSVYNNYVEVSGGKVTDTIIGGWLHADNSGTYVGTVSYNTVKIINLISSSRIYGGQGGSNANVENNTVLIESTFNGQAGDLYGGSGINGNVNSNNVTINSGNTRQIFGGASFGTGNADSNIVKVTNTTAYYSVFGGVSTAGNSNSNQVTIKNSDITGTIYGGRVNDTGKQSNSNIVRVSDTRVSGNITAGNSSTGAENEVYLAGVTALDIVGGYSHDNLVRFESGVNNVRAVTNAGDIEILDGTNTFTGLVSNLKAGDSVNITGGESFFQMGLTSLGEVNIESATVYLYSSQTYSATNGFTVDAGGAIDIGKQTVSITNGNVTFKAGAALNLDGDSATKGTLTTGNNVTFEDNSKIRLTYTGATDPWVANIQLVQAGGTLTVNVDKIDSGFYELVKSGTNILEVAGKNTIDDVLDTASVDITPNIQAGSALMSRIAVASQTDASLVPLNRDLETAVMNIIDNYPDETEEALKQLVGESVAGVNTAVSTTVLKNQSVVFNRLDRVREIEFANLTPPAAGSGSELNRIWVGGFGIWSQEDDSDTVRGYKYAGGGVALGYDRKFEGVPGLRLGISGVYANGRIKNNDGRTSVDLSTVGVGVYGSYVLPNNVFFDASVAYANTRNEYSTNLIVGGRKTGTFHINSWQFGVRGGVVIKGDNWQIIPSVGVRYLFLRQGAFADTLNAAAAGNTVGNYYRSRTDHQVDIPVQIKFNTTVKAGSATLTPELRLGYNFAVKKLDNAMEVGFVGAADTARVVGPRARGNSFQAGVGLKVNTGGVVDFFVNYDLDVSNHYRSHNASLGLGFEF
jgi:uncharacterized protein with beta-barrel porin domain